MESLENLHRKIQLADDLHSVVRDMKAMAAANIGQYEMSVSALKDYAHSVDLGIVAYFSNEIPKPAKEKKGPEINKVNSYCAIVFGSDLGLVGQFNDKLANMVFETMKPLPGKKEIWAVGDRVHALLMNIGLTVSELFLVPNSINAISPLVTRILLKAEEVQEKEPGKIFYIFYNKPGQGATYSPMNFRFLPIDKDWRNAVAGIKWPTNKKPQIAGDSKATLLALIHEYLFVSLFRASAESLASENASRLSAMQRAEKNIEELKADLKFKYHNLRQSSIDNELFDVLAGFEILKDDKRKTK